MPNGTEIWKDVIGYEGLYQVSNKGFIKSLDRTLQFTRYGKPDKSVRRGRVLILENHNTGYRTVKLCRGNKSKTALVHVLVARAFIDATFTYPEFEVNHLDGDKYNNCVSNLEVATKSQNQIHAFKTGLNTRAKGQNSPNAKLSNDAACTIRAEYAAGGLTLQNLADNYGVSQTAVHNIIRNATYTPC